MISVICEIGNSNVKCFYEDSALVLFFIDDNIKFNFYFDEDCEEVLYSTNSTLCHTKNDMIANNLIENYLFDIILELENEEYLLNLDGNK